MNKKKCLSIAAALLNKKLELTDLILATALEKENDPKTGNPLQRLGYVVENYFIDGYGLIMKPKNHYLYVKTIPDEEIDD